ncbi:hypothetical protein D3C72_1758270 [compost metagenome]
MRVEGRGFGFRKQAAWDARRSAHHGNSQCRDGAKAVGPQLRCLPCNAGAPVPADDHRLIRPLALDQRHQVADHVERREGPDVRGAFAGAVTSQIWRHGAEPRLGKGRELVPPGMRGLGKAMAQHDQGPLAHRGDMQRDAVDFQIAGFGLNHGDGSQQVSDGL